MAAGVVGSFAYMKRMLLASDVISHLALPGLGVAFLLKLNPLAGGAVSLFLGTLLIWRIQQRTSLGTDATIGIVFAAALALGAAVTPREDLLEALFGASQPLSFRALLIGAAAAGFIVLVLFRMEDQLAISIFSPELAASIGVRTSRLELYFLLLFSLTVLVGLRFMGALLGSALMIVPAATAHQLTRRISSFVMISCAASLLSVSIGWLIRAMFLPHSAPGPVIAIVSAVLFALSFLRRL